VTGSLHCQRLTEEHVSPCRALCHTSIHTHTQRSMFTNHQHSVTTSLVVRRTRLSTYGDRAFPVAASRVCNSLPSHHVTSAQSLPVFCSRLKTYLFRRSFPRLFCCAREVTLVIMDTLVVLTYLLTIKQCVL